LPGKQLFSTFEPMVLADVNGDSWPDIVRYDFFWPDGITETYGPAKFSTYLDQPSGTFVQSSSYAAYQGIPTQPGPYLQLGDPTATALLCDFSTVDQAGLCRSRWRRRELSAAPVVGGFSRMSRVPPTLV